MADMNYGRRVPAHLSVSLKQPRSHDTDRPLAGDHQGPSVTSQSSDLARVRMEGWLDRSGQSTNSPQPSVRENGAPSSSMVNVAPSAQSFHSLPHHPAPFLTHATADSSSDDFRSVIDDLTIENRRLKERLRRHETRYGSHIDKDRLFEIRFHGLPPAKRKELEDTLRVFAASVSASSEGASGTHEDKSRRVRGYARHAKPGAYQNTFSSSTSESRLVDSAYGSNTQSASVKHRGEEQKTHNVQTFLREVPMGLIPQPPARMTERQKKRVVVRRLEQLFTGKISGNVGDHSQPIQQQEVSHSASRADGIDSMDMDTEGAREAHMLSRELDVDMAKGTDPPGSPQQRPTRPLDLDPDRAQNPVDNVEYIRHLGISTPQLITEDSSDVESDSEGWVYLNVLINMAQLHIINVTPDFVRSAVADVSTRFQLSPDGSKIRWRGGTQGTRLSSESPESSTLNLSSSVPDSDSPDDSRAKRRKTDSTQPVSGETGGNGDPSSVSANPNSFHYKPLFAHQPSLEHSSSLESSSSSQNPSGESQLGLGGRVGAWGRVRTRSEASSVKRARDDGPIIFFRGANFYTDLSGDVVDLPQLWQNVELDLEAQKQATSHEILGFETKRPSGLPRTPSGSILPVRPFKDYSFISQQGKEEARGPASDLIWSDPAETDKPFSWTPTSPLVVSAKARSLHDFPACGLGGTQPADHFVVRVERTCSRRRISSSAVDTSIATATKEHAARALHLTRVSATPPLQRPLTVKPPLQPIQTEITSMSFERLPPSTLPPPLGVSMSSTSSSYTSSSESEESMMNYNANEFRNLAIPWPARQNAGRADRPLPVRSQEPSTLENGKLQAMTDTLSELQDADEATEESEDDDTDSSMESD